MYMCVYFYYHCVFVFSIIVFLCCKLLSWHLNLVLQIFTQFWGLRNCFLWLESIFLLPLWPTLFLFSSSCLKVRLMTWHEVFTRCTQISNAWFPFPLVYPSCAACDWDGEKQWFPYKILLVSNISFSSCNAVSFLDFLSHCLKLGFKGCDNQRAARKRLCALADA